jgi:hypothetical protein
MASERPAGPRFYNRGILGGPRPANAESADSGLLFTGVKRQYPLIILSARPIIAPPPSGRLGSPALATTRGYLPSKEMV